MDRKEQNKEYYQKNKEQIKIRQKEYYENNKEQISQRKKEHYVENKEKKKEYYVENKEQILEYHKEYYVENIEQIKEYRKSPKGKKSNKITKWKRYGIIFFDFDLLYEIYISTTHCEFCDVELTTDRFNTSTTRCLDHDHNITNYDNVRNILCHACNVKRQ